MQTLIIHSEDVEMETSLNLISNKCQTGADITQRKAAKHHTTKKPANNHLLRSQWINYESVLWQGWPCQNCLPPKQTHKMISWFAAIRHILNLIF